MPRSQQVIPNSGSISFSADNKSGRIILGLISPLPGGVLSALSEHLQKEFSVPVETLELNWNVSFAFNRRRNQYSSPKILNRLKAVPQRTGDKLLAIVDVDLYCPDYDFIFGEADAEEGIATLSTHRLEEGTNDTKLISKRIVKEATHEIGHLFNLGHCEDPKCVMSFSVGDLSQIDAKSASVCLPCKSPAPASRSNTTAN
ncbi:archaemetzincin [Dehalogenimonas formicexedens]|uniref:Archaemetzincin n=1 Tax=Dehalogenimonas formicexedens TaxID=1839801 RepID=A0A1P8F7S9_9CHLR|nr:archaemetzincin [Dehalogenimonas formicexedens]